MFASSIKPCWPRRAGIQKWLSVILLLTLLANNSLAKPDSYKVTFTKTQREQLLDTMVLVKGGQFTMGSDAANAKAMEQPAHRVTLSTFSIGKTEVTQKLFQQFMGWNHSYFPCAECPVNNISWLNAQQFIQRLNTVTGLSFSLPSEAQWEYAARGGQFSQGYIYSGSNTISKVAWFADNANRRSHKVALKQANELGLYDMTGNLWEFCLDDFKQSAYKRDNSPAKDPILSREVGPNARTVKVIRGGGYEFEAGESEVFRRDGTTSNVKMPDIGFRLLLNHPEEPFR